MSEGISTVISVGTVVIAGIALVMSVRNAKWQRDYLRRQEQREVDAAVPRVSIRVTYDTEKVRDGFGGRVYEVEDYILVTVTNAGERPVSVTRAGLVTNTGRFIPFDKERDSWFPARLDRAEHLNVWSVMSDVQDDLEEEGDHLAKAVAFSDTETVGETDELGPFKGMGKKPEVVQ